MARVIAIIDDDDAVRESLGAVLEAAGLEVQAFASGPEFFAADLSPAPECVLLDLNLSEMSGWEVLDELTARHTGTASIIITGRGDQSTRGRALKAGAFEMLDKPIRPRMLLDVIERAIGKSA